MSLQGVSHSAKFGALKGSIELAINKEEYRFNGDMSQIIAENGVPGFYDFVNKRIVMSNKLILKCMQSSGVSQAALCDEINCEKTQMNKVLKSVENDTASRFPRSIPFTAMEGMSNNLDIDISKLFLGLDLTIPLPKIYEFALSKVGSLNDRKQTTTVKRIQELSREYLSSPNIMTLDNNTPIQPDEFRCVLGRRCRMYTDERNMPPAYIMENGQIRRKATNLFETLNDEQPTFVGRISVMMAICYASNLPLEYFMVRDLSQQRLVTRIRYFQDNKPTEQQLKILRLLCSTEQNIPLHSEIIADILSC